jgi:glutamine amidotransferase-like uncharacterized protein
LLIYAGEGASKEAPPQVQKCLPASRGFETKTISAAEIRSGALAQFDVLIQPGGSGSGQAKALGDEGCQRVKKFVDGGGGYVGICAGSYLASAQYPWSLGLLNARVIDTKHWERGAGKVELRFTGVGQTALRAEDETCSIHFENGPLLGPNDSQDGDAIELLAAFDSEIAENGAPAGVMKGTAAIARGKYGSGRVVCFSPHPEKTPGREALLQSAVRWAAANRN